MWLRMLVWAVWAVLGSWGLGGLGGLGGRGGRGGLGGHDIEGCCCLVVVIESTFCRWETQKEEFPRGERKQQVACIGPFKKTCSDGGGEKKTGRGLPVHEISVISRFWPRSPVLSATEVHCQSEGGFSVIYETKPPFSVGFGLSVCRSGQVRAGMGGLGT